MLWKPMPGNNQKIDVLVHLGAGRCSELDQYLALQPGRLLLVEADRQLANGLQTRTAHLPQAQVVCASVAGCSGPATLHHDSLPDASSLHEASGMKNLFPGLKATTQIQVEAVRPESLLQPLQLAAHQTNILIIDLPGEEFPVLRALQDAQSLHLFSNLFLFCDREPLNAGGAAALDILHWLQDQGFDLVEGNQWQKYDRPYWALKRNALLLENRALQAQVQKLTQERDEHAKWQQENHQWAQYLNVENKTLRHERDFFQGQIITLEGEVNKRQRELENVLRALTFSQSQQDNGAPVKEIFQLKQLEFSSGQVSQENDLLLLQLHQVQEELETVFSQQQALQTENTQLRQTHQTLESVYKDTSQNNEVLLSQLHQLQEELQTVLFQKQQLELACQRKEPVPPDKGNAAEHEQPATAADACKRASGNTTSKTRAAIGLLKKFYSASPGGNGTNKREDNESVDQIKLIKESGLFDEAWYLRRYADVARSGIDPVKHYLGHGAAEGRDPSPNFNTRNYLMANQNLAESGMNPLIHYVLHGEKQLANGKRHKRFINDQEEANAGKQSKD